MSHTRAVLFHRAMAPYEAGDIAGFPHIQAQNLVERAIATFHPAIVEVVEPDILDAMDRDQLIAFGKENLGMTDEPPADVSDAALREALRVGADPALLVVKPEPETGKPGKSPKKT